jgi:hypothetical protein
MNKETQHQAIKAKRFFTKNRFLSIRKKRLKPIFSRHPDIEKMSFVNWRFDGHEIQNLMCMADGYLDSAIILARECVKDNTGKRADIIIFPILTSVNHGIELYLKALIWMLNKLLKRPSRIEGRHNIDQMYRNLKSKINEYSGQGALKEFEFATHELQAYIHELFSKTNATPKDDKMDFSRYPFSNKYENHFYVEAQGTVEIDLVNFIKRFTLIKRRLRSVSSFLFYEKLLDILVKEEEFKKHFVNG